MKFTSVQKEIRALLTSGYYRVPRFQRPYSWTREELDEFWSDAIVEGDESYFIGSVVVFKAEPGIFGIVDGQQRLTTITILLASIRNAFEKCGSPDLASGLQTMIERQNVKSLPQFILQPETSHPYFQEYIQKRGDPEVKVELLEEENSLRLAHEYLSSQVDSAISAIQDDSTLSAARKSAKIKAKLEKMRDQLLGLSLIFVELDDEDDACLVFETLNARGKDLRVSDLVKNHLSRHLKIRTKTVDTLKARWGQVVETIEGSSASIRVDEFVHHQWLSAREYTSEKKLFKAIKKAIGKTDASDYLNELVRESDWYRAIFEPSAATWQKSEIPIRDSLHALTTFGVQQPAPFLLSLIVGLRTHALKPSQVADALNAVEVFHFQFTAIASQSSSGGISQMYAKHAREVRDAKSSEQAMRSIRELKKKLKERLPGKTEFDARFVELAYSNTFTRDRKLVRYALGRLARTALKSKALDYENMTIEHLAPQSGSTLAHDYVANIGNLIIVDESLNEKLADKPFAAKRSLLARAPGVWMDDVLKKTKDWAEPDITARAGLLARLAREKAWRM